MVLLLLLVTGGVVVGAVVLYNDPVDGTLRSSPTGCLWLAVRPGYMSGAGG